MPFDRYTSLGGMHRQAVYHPVTPTVAGRNFILYLTLHIHAVHLHKYTTFPRRILLPLSSSYTTTAKVRLYAVRKPTSTGFVCISYIPLTFGRVHLYAVHTSTIAGCISILGSCTHLGEVHFTLHIHPPWRGAPPCHTYTHLGGVHLHAVELAPPGGLQQVELGLAGRLARQAPVRLDDPTLHLGVLAW